MKNLILTFLSIAFTLNAGGAFPLNSGDSYEWSFTLEPGGRYFATSIRFNSEDKLGSGDSMRIEFYESSILDDPVFSRILHGSSLNGSSGYFFLDFPDYGFFPDREGVWVIQMLAGSVDLGELYVASYINGSLFSAAHTPVNVPEPRHAAVILPLILFGHTLVRRRNNRIPTNRGSEQREAAPTKRSRRRCHSSPRSAMK